MGARGLANVKVTLYQSIKIGGKWTLRKAPPQRLRTLSEGGYYVRYGNRMEPAGPDPAVAIAALKRKQAELAFLALGGEVKSDESGAEESTRVRLADAVREYIADCRDREGKSGYGPAPKTVQAYEYRLSFLTSFRPEGYLDEIDSASIRAFRRYLRQHGDDLGDRSCFKVMQAVSTFLVKNNNTVAKPILSEMSYPPTPIIPYSDHELRRFLAPHVTKRKRPSSSSSCIAWRVSAKVAFAEVRPASLAQDRCNAPPRIKRPCPKNPDVARAREP